MGDVIREIERRKKVIVTSILSFFPTVRIAHEFFLPQKNLNSVYIYPVKVFFQRNSLKFILTSWIIQHYMWISVNVYKTHNDTIRPNKSLLPLFSRCRSDSSNNGERDSLKTLNMKCESVYTKMK